MDCTMLKKMRPIPDYKSQLFLLLFRTQALFWLLITISTDHYQYLSDPSYRQLQLFLLLHMPGSSKMAENRPHFLRSVAIRAVNSVYIIHRWFEYNAKSFKKKSKTCHYIIQLCIFSNKDLYFLKIIRIVCILMQKTLECLYRNKRK